MNRYAKFFFAALGLSLCARAAADGMYKCKDAAGRITYAGRECNLLGLIPAGEVTGRASVTPALKFQQPPPVALPAPPVPAAAAEAPEQSGKSSDSAAAKEDRRCFTVKTAKGTATRCNEVPK